LAPASNGSVLNALTVDVEDYFQVSAFEHCVSGASWGLYESRVVRNTERLLKVFDAFHVRGTFFVLGWVAEHFPDLVRTIAREGHEIASHGYAHGLVYASTPEEFRTDIARAADVIGCAVGLRVRGYRAPSFSITARTLWALDVLIDEGYVFDASIYPIRHDRYGIPDWPRHAQLLQRQNGWLWEVPGTTISLGGTNLPIGGGGYFRLLPYAWTRRGIGRLNEIERQPAVFYLHPWELDPEQPRIAAGALSRVRHYSNLHKTESRLRRLLTDFRFGAVADVLALRESVDSATGEAGLVTA
jgi:polysaccharide deacetylase family protein (PEP-CTERM system associated)